MHYSGRPTKKKHMQRIQQAKRLLERGCYDWEIKVLIAHREGVSRRTVERYLKTARELIRSDLKKSKGQLRRDAIAVYKGILKDKGAQHRDRIKAQERIDRLLGLDEPMVVHQRVEGHITHNHTYRAIVEIARKDEEVRDLLLQLSRRVSTQ